MLYPPVADLLKNVDSRYLLVNVVAHRARQIAVEATAFEEELPEKPVTLAIQEVASTVLPTVRSEGSTTWTQNSLVAPVVSLEIPLPV